MEIYKNKSNWKWLLAIMGFVIVLVTMLYSKYLADNLEERELITVSLYSTAINSILKQSNVEANDDTSMELFIISQIGDIPIITENDSGFLTGYNYGNEGETEDQEFLKAKKAEILKRGYEPIKGLGGYATNIYYENSNLYRKISLFPLAQILLLSTFVLFGYYVFSTSRKAEQNKVWAGMAKETAHQLGTPISAIIGWIEFLKDTTSSETERQEIVTELRNDVTRLELIADRFSKIGSKPELEKINLIEELNDCKIYMQKRAPQKVSFTFPELNSQPIYANINSHLFDWVVENLIRNALDAMQAEGNINCEIISEGNKAIVNLSDTGKGIPSNKFKSVFNPGYTTKKRGWGLGLSLAKRIIDDYHNGKIFVKNSEPHVKTTFSIHLPLA